MLPRLIKVGSFLLIFTLKVEAQEPIQMDSIRVEDEAVTTDSSVSGEVIETRQARDLEDTFRESPEVVVGGSSRVAQKVYVRGLEDTNLNVTVDGARQAGYLFHHQGRLNIDPELLKEVEVEAGTGNALAGPGALGGSIRFVTKDAEDLLLPGQRTGLLVKSRYATNNEELGGALAVFTKPSDKWSALLYGNYSELKDAKTGKDNVTIPYTAAKPQAYLGKITVRPTLEQKLTLGFNFTSDNAVRLVRSNIGYTPSQPITDKIFETRNTTFNYAYSPIDSISKVEADVYRAENRLEHSSGTSRTSAEFASWGASFKNRLKRTSTVLTLGADFNEDRALARNATNSAEEKGQITGIFAQGYYDISEKWRIGSGLRWDDYRLTTVNQTSLSEKSFNPNANLRYRWNEQVASTLTWAQSFRGPTPVEALLLANATSVSAAQNLKGTVAQTTEFSTSYKEKNSVLQLSAFQTQLKDALESSVANGVITRKNATDTLYVDGYQAKYKRIFDALTSSVFYMHAKTRYGANPLGYTGNLTRGVSLGDRLGLTLDWRMPLRSLFFTWNSNLVLKLTDVPANQKPQDGYDIHDLALTWLPSERIRTGVSIHNIFDRKYVAQGSTYANNSGVENFLYEPGRDFRASFSYIF